MPTPKAYDIEKDPRELELTARAISRQIDSPSYKSAGREFGKAHMKKLNYHDAVSVQKFRSRVEKLRAPQTRRELLSKAYDEQVKMDAPFKRERERKAALAKKYPVEARMLEEQKAVGNMKRGRVL